ncbi:hypothetical protein DL546_006374 [Coniochaeta pulveracea]|uniref:Uncharacterized protein n=1 Tax=Coniochaeta pulveracea TaxID=177199 RepID=A0A420Y6L3_9PEZI|nr:hypothetical protein DL546_006374 [Coniochaeta pulveracea]
MTSSPSTITPSTFRNLTSLTLLSTTALASLTLSLSTISTPLFLSPPPLPTPTLLHLSVSLLSISRTLFSRLLPFITTAPYLALSYLPPANFRGRKYFVIAAALTMLTAPYRWLVMGREERMLEARAKALAVGVLGKKECEVVERGLPRIETARYLVDRWGLLNLGRVAMLAGAGIIVTEPIFFTIRRFHIPLIHLRAPYDSVEPVGLESPQRREMTLELFTYNPRLIPRQARQAHTLDVFRDQICCRFVHEALLSKARQQSSLVTHTFA